MSLISNFLRRRYLIFLYLLTFLIIINPFTLSFLDDSPPLSNLSYMGIYMINIFNFLGVALFIFKKEIFIQFAITCFLIIIFDLAISKFTHTQTFKDFLLNHPEPYVGAEYYSEEFILESINQPGGWFLFTKNDDSFVLPNNFEGKWFNVKDHKRRTVNVDDVAFKNKLYLFGGSTVYCSEVPDYLTLASQLASNSANEASFEVVNMGVNSIIADQQFARLRSDITLNENDIVVFYDGVNDIYQRIIYENQEGFMQGKPKNEPLLEEGFRLIAKYSSIVELLLNIMYDNVKPIPNNLVQDSIDRYIETIRNTEKYVTSQNANFFHFLQPTLFTKKNLNDYESLLIRMGSPIVPNQVKAAFDLAYPILSERLLSEENSVSLTDSFDHLETSPYLDAFHVNHIGNQVIAKQIWSTIRHKSTF